MNKKPLSGVRLSPARRKRIVGETDRRVMAHIERTTWSLVYIGTAMTPRIALWPPGFSDPDVLVSLRYRIPQHEAENMTIAELEAWYPFRRDLVEK